jgi:hypothetical protein
MTLDQRVPSSSPGAPTTQSAVLAFCRDCRERPAVGGVFCLRSGRSRSPFADVRRFRPLVSGPKILVHGAVQARLSPAAKAPFPPASRRSNTGSHTRLDFTVIGPIVNMAGSRCYAGQIQNGYCLAASAAARLIAVAAFMRSMNFVRRSKYLCLILADRLCFGASGCCAVAGTATVKAAATTTIRIFLIVSPKLPASKN